LLFTAVRLTERRKGAHLLESALRSVRFRPLTLITLGLGNLPIEDEGVRVHSLGYLDHERTMALAYNAADVVVHPAPVDNLPNTVMESIACGTPVVAFPTGGIPDMVRPGITGWLAEGLSSESLGVALDRALSELALPVDLRLKCRAVAESEYDDKLQASRYLLLFEDIMRRA
jgi:glycosyltransferase involved in cell wall biosynthesis